MVVAFTYASGAVGTLYYSWEMPVLMKGLHLSAVYGTEGVASFESNGIFLSVRGRRRGCAPRRSTSPATRGCGATSFPRSSPNREPRFDFDKARRDLVLTEAVYRSLGRDLSVPGLTA